MDPYALAGFGIGVLFSIVVLIYPDRQWLFDRRYVSWVVVSFLIGIGVSVTMAVLPPDRAAQFAFGFLGFVGGFIVPTAMVDRLKISRLEGQVDKWKIFAYMSAKVAQDSGLDGSQFVDKLRDLGIIEEEVAQTLKVSLKLWSKV
jgi:hypothetical protein